MLRHASGHVNVTTKEEDVIEKQRKVRWWATIALAIGLSGPALADQKDTLIVALDTLGAQTMDPILAGRAPHAHYQAPVYDALIGFNYEKG